MFQRSTKGGEALVASLNYEEQAWKKIDELMFSKKDDTVKILADLGISEGNADDESDEGQIWQMVEGRLPYTLDMV